MNFFKKVRASFYSPSFYQEIMHQSFWKAFRYYLFLSLVLTLIGVISLLQTIGQKIPSTVQSVVTQAVDFYPQELVINITDGQVSTNVEEPYFVSLPASEYKAGQPNNLVVIDTKTPFSSTQFNQYQTIAWLTKDGLFYLNSDKGEIRGMDLSKVNDFTINKNLVQELSSKFSPWLKLLGPILLFFAGLGLYLSFSFRLIYLLLFTLIVWVTMIIVKRRLSYPQLYKVGLYALTPGLILDQLIGLSQSFTRFQGFPFMFTLVTLVVVFLNLSKSKSKAN